MDNINKDDALITVNDLFEDDELVLMKAFFENGTYHYSVGFKNQSGDIYDIVVTKTFKE